MVFIRVLWWLFVGPQRRRFSKVWATYKYGGIKLCWHRAVEKFGQQQKYNHEENQLTHTQSNYILSLLPNTPLFSIIVPVYKVDKEWLEKCISSVVSQHYRNWELVLVDDASKKDDLKQLMNAWASRDSRIHAYYLEQNSGIAGATNFGIKQASGEFIGFLDHDDELTPDALTWVVSALNKYPSALWFYSDEDKISPSGDYHFQYFKPDFSPELLLSNMFTCHFSVYSADILSKVDGIRRGFEGAQDHDLALRISEIVRRDQVVHIPRVLYHWREIQASAAAGIEAKPKAPVAGRKAVAEALKRRNLKGTVASHKLCPTLYQITLQPTSFPKVSIIIPTRNSLSLMKKCLSSLRSCTNYPNYDIVVIDNQSDDESFLEYTQEEQSKDLLKVIKYDKPFNHSEMNNMAVKSIDSDFIVFMNNDIEIISDNWLEQLVATAQTDPAIALVGALLVYPNGQVQHGGIILGLNGVVGHAHKHIDGKSIGYFGRLYCLQEMSGVTSAFSLVKSSAYEAVGGFNSERYPTSFNDADLCIRLRKNDFRCIYNPMIRAIHDESQTRFVSENELSYRKNIVEDHGKILNCDPFYNPNLALNNEQFHGYRPFPVTEQIPELANMPEEVS